jgi:putative nucleotidyltransferase with HDIG domain
MAISTRPLILVVDNKRFGRDLLRLALQEEGYDVEAVAGAPEALAALPKHPVRAVVVNIHRASDFTILSMVKEMRAQPRCEHLPVLVLTDDEYPEVQEWTRQVGVGDFCAKGHASLGDFLRRVRQLLIPAVPQPSRAAETAGRGSGHTTVVRRAVQEQTPLPAAAPPGLDYKLRTLDGLCPLPAIANELLLLVQTANPPMESMLEIIRRDRALAATVLRIANSTFYGGRERVHTLERSLVRLGMNGLRDLALGLCLAGRIYRPRRPDGLPPVPLWQHSMGVAIAARALAFASGSCEPEMAFVAGLLHDIGKDVFDELAPEEYAAAMREAAAGGLLEAERRAFAMDHGEIGARALRQWRIPAPIPEAAALHHTPWADLLEAPPEIRGPVVAVRVADAVAKARRVGRSPLDQFDALPVEALAASGISPQWLRPLADSLPGQVEELQEILLMNDPLFASAPPVPAAVAAGRKAWLDGGTAADRALLSAFLGALGYEVAADEGEAAGSELAVAYGVAAGDVESFLRRAGAVGAERAVLIAGAGHAPLPAVGGHVAALRLPFAWSSLEGACVGAGSPA